MFKYKRSQGDPAPTRALRYEAVRKPRVFSTRGTAAAA